MMLHMPLDALHMVYTYLTDDDAVALSVASQYHRDQTRNCFISYKDWVCRLAPNGVCDGVIMFIPNEIISVAIYENSNLCIDCIHKIFTAVSTRKYLHTFIMHLYNSADAVPLSYVDWLANESASLTSITCNVYEINTLESQAWVTVIKENTGIDIDIVWSSPPRFRH